MAGFLDRIKKAIKGEESDYEEYNGQKMADSYKSAKDLYKEGEDVAGRQANNMAAQAGANAKANAMMNGGSRMAAALAGANAASQAGNATYNNVLSDAKNTAQMQNTRMADAMNAAMQANTKLANDKSDKEQATATNRWNNLVNGFGKAASMLGKRIFGD